MYNPGLGQINRLNKLPWLARLQSMLGPYTTLANGVAVVGVVFALVCLLAVPSAQFANVRLVFYLIASIWILLRPRVALYLLPIAIPWGSQDVTNGGLSLRGYDADVLVALLSVSWLLGFTLRPLAAVGAKRVGPLDREYFSTFPRYITLTLTLLVLTMLLSMTVAVSVSASLKEIVKWLEVAVVLLLGAQYIRTRRQIWTLVIIICLAALSQAVFGYAQAFFNLGPASFVRDSSLRVYGSFGQPNPYAGYINMSLMLTLALFLLGHNWLVRLLAGASTLLLAGVEYYSQSKGGWLAFAVSFLFILGAGFPRLRAWIATGTVLLLAALAAIFTGAFPLTKIEPVLERLGLIDISFTNPTHASYANSERLAHWVAGIKMFIAHPLLGVGIGNYGNVYYPDYTVGIFIIPLGHAHNYYINIAAEAGIFAFVAYILFLAATFVAGNRSLRTLNTRFLQRKIHQVQLQRGTTQIDTENTLSCFSILKNDRALAVGLLAALLSISVHNLVDNLYVHSMTSLFALLLVLLIRLEGVSQMT